MKNVMVFGTFDLLHPGHEYFLKEAKKRGDFLTVVVARDSTVLEVKSRLPQESEIERLEKIRNLAYVDRAILGSAGKDKYGIVRKEKPDVICLGYDQEAFVKGLEGVCKCSIVRLKPHEPHKYKTSKLREHANL